MQQSIGHAIQGVIEPRKRTPEQEKDYQLRMLQEATDAENVKQSGTLNVKQSGPDPDVKQSRQPSEPQSRTPAEMLNRINRYADRQGNTGSSGNSTNYNGGENRRSEQQETDQTANVAEVQDQNLNNETAAWFAEHGDKRFGEYLVAAYEKSEADKADPFRWQSPLFGFVYLVKGHSDTEKHASAPMKVCDTIELFLRAWSNKRFSENASPPYGMTNDPWNDWFSVPRAEARAEFSTVWAKLRYRPGQGPLHLARDCARRCRLKLWNELAHKRPIDTANPRSESDYEFFVNVAAHLQIAMGNRPIMLPVSHIAALMGVSAMTISRYRDAAIEDGFLKLVKAHKFSSRGGGKASEFVFNVDRIDSDHIRQKVADGTSTTFHISQSVSKTKGESA